MSFARQSLHIERTPSGEPPPPPDPCVSRECGTCYTERCPAESWEKAKRYYAVRYRTGAVERALDVLYDHSPAVAQAVYYEYVEPWAEFNPCDRPKWSEAGLHFLATFIPGDIPFHSPDSLHEPWRREARDLRKQGLSLREIAKRVGRSLQSIHSAVRGYRILHGRRRK